jgi:hypothetical protein
MFEMPEVNEPGIEHEKQTTPNDEEQYRPPDVARQVFQKGLEGKKGEKRAKTQLILL